MTDRKPEKWIHLVNNESNKSQFLRIASKTVSKLQLGSEVRLRICFEVAFSYDS